MSKTTILFFFLFISLTACKDSFKAEVNVVSLKDTIELGDKHTSEIYVKSNIECFTAFYTIHKSDTFYLPYNEEKKCGIYNVRGTVLGYYEHKGYVDCCDSNGILKTLPFEINLFVKDTVN